MKPTTDMREAMVAAGVPTPAQRLYNLAIDLLRKGGWNAQVSRQSMVDALGGDPELLLPLFGEAKISERAVQYLRERALEARPQGMPRGARSQSEVDAQPGAAPASRQQNGEGRGQKCAGAHSARAPSSPTPRAGDTGHVRCDAQDAIAPSAHPIASGGGQVESVNQMNAAPSVREPSEASRRIAGRVALEAAKSVLDSFKVSDGRSIGDVLVTELHRLRFDHIHKASVLRLVEKKIGGGYVPPGTKVRDLVSEDEMNRIVQKGAEAADAA